jgi:small-conductance mechanosensitive channel
METQHFFSGIWLSNLLLTSLRIVIIIVLAYFLIKLTKLITRGLRRLITAKIPTDNQEVERRTKTLGSVTESILKITIIIVAAMMIMKELGLDIRPLIAAAGIGAVAIGFGAQSLIKDFFSGFFIILENQFRLGDIVNIGSVTGEVIAINLRTTVLRDLEGKVHIIPNGEITMVSNLTREWARCILDIGVAYKEKVDYVIEELKKILSDAAADPDLRALFLDPPDVLGVQELGDSSVNIRVWVKTQPGMQWAVSRELRRRIKNRFDEVGIEIPFPHQTLYLGQDVVFPIKNVA